MPKELFCDKCGSNKGADEDYDGYILCEFHRAEYDLASAKHQYKDKRDWVKSVWFTQLHNMRTEIRRLECLLTTLAQDQPLAEGNAGAKAKSTSASDGSGNNPAGL